MFKFLKLGFLMLMLAPQLYGNKTVITVFIHGAIAPGAVLFSPRGLYNQKLNSDCNYGKIASRVRKEKKMQHDWPMLNEGMIEISSEILEHYHNKNLDPKLGKYAAYQLTGSYDYFQKKLSPKQKNLYFFYGHNGLLNENERVKSGIDLCAELANIRKNYTEEDTVIFHLIGHSHGGTIGLYTAFGTESDKKNITIKKLILLGTPLQKGQAELINNPMFEKIYNFFSNGDAMQKKDFISTATGKSYAKLSDIIDKNNCYKNRYDISLSVEGKKTAFTHHTLWLLNKYDNATSMKFGKKNNKIKKTFKRISPLPLASYLPFFINTIDNQGTEAQNLIEEFKKDDKKIVAINLNLRRSKKPKTITIDKKEKIFLESKLSNVITSHFTTKIKTKHKVKKDDLEYVTNRAKKLWQPYAMCSEIGKHKLIIKSAWRTLLNK